MWIDLLRAWGGDVLASWGRSSLPLRNGESERELRVLLDDDHIGSLTIEEGDYVFRYTKAYRESERASPISAFPYLHQEYRSSDLWPFFAVRIPPLGRDDVRALMERTGVRKDDPLALLDVLGGRSIAAPYVFSLFESRQGHGLSSTPAPAYGG